MNQYIYKLKTFINANYEDILSSFYFPLVSLININDYPHNVR